MTDHLDTVRTIEQRVRVAASPETVWKFWTDASRLCEWWGIEAEIEAQPGGIFRISMSADGPIMSGTYVTLEPLARLVFTFGWEGNPMGEALAPGTTQVEVTLTAIDADTDLLLVHRELPEPYADEHARGWALFIGERLPVAAAETTRQPKPQTGSDAS